MSAWSRLVGKQRRTAGVVAVIGVSLVGTVLLIFSHAATPSASLESENGTLSSSCMLKTDSTASGGSMVQFGPCGGSSNGSWPNGSNTGYSGTLAAYTGPANITTNGTTISNKLISGCLNIQARDVIITNSHIVGDKNCASQGAVVKVQPDYNSTDVGTYNSYMSNSANSATQNLANFFNAKDAQGNHSNHYFSAYLTNVEIDTTLDPNNSATLPSSTGSTLALFGFSVSGVTHLSQAAVPGIGSCANCKIHDVSDGVGGSSYSVTDSYIYNMLHYKSPGASASDNGTHNEDILSNGLGPGEAINVNHSSMENLLSQTAVIALFGDFNPIHDVTIVNNLFNGGGYTVYGGCSKASPAYGGGPNVVITGNHFMRDTSGSGSHTPGYWQSGGYFGAEVGNCAQATNNVTDMSGSQWSGNVWDDSPTTVIP